MMIPIAEKKSRVLLPMLVLLTLVLHLHAAPDATAEPTEGEKLFALHVKPLFADKCNACHGDEPDKLKGDFDMRSREAVLKGGETFGDEVLIPGEGSKSFLYRVTTRAEKDYEMPPKEADKLSEEQTWMIRDWIDAGAPWLDDERVAAIQEEYATGEQVRTSKALSDDWQNRRYKSEHLWAFRPLQSTEVPADAHPVDWFLQQKLDEFELKPALPARARELVRRISFGLTGLPPSAEQTTAFVSAHAKDPAGAIRDFAAELMASPHYGEHFARHWLDVSRYADSGGYANDYARPHAWRYRDYVVRAFNDDKPFNDFVREQLAGDEMPKEEKTNAEQTSERILATSFLRMGAWEQTGMSVFRETRQLWLDDVTDTVGQAFLAQPMSCCKCHDHKFDPIPTRDYYRMMAVFSSTQFAERPAPFLASEHQGGFEEAKRLSKEKVAGYSGQVAELNKRMADQRKKETGDAKTGDNGLDPGDEASLARMKKNMIRHNIEAERVKGLAHAVYTGKTIVKNNVQGRIDLPENPWAKGHIEADTILTGGDAFTRGDPVQPGALSAAEALGEMAPRSFPDGMGKRRLALADWIVAEDNPLTARVIVNRVWAWHFGQGLAGNPNNFGATGSLPTHPELLDYLAGWFIENGWSIKQLNALLLSSDAYARSSNQARHPAPATLAERDPKQQSYALFLPRRLHAEEIRDAMLAVSGELNRQVGGIPARPDINLEVALQPRQIMGGTASVYEPDPLPAQRNRRSLYAEKQRGLRDPFFESFNQPGPDTSCEFRETSTVAPQALTLINSEEVQDRALALAANLIAQHTNPNRLIEALFERTLSRPPTATEHTQTAAFWTWASTEEDSMTHKGKTFPAQIERTVMAEKTGEPYTFTEFMPAYKTYVPDLQAAETDARTRGLAHVCLVIFNLNEFLYLD